MFSSVSSLLNILNAGYIPTQLFFSSVVYVLNVKKPPCKKAMTFFNHHMVLQVPGLTNLPPQS